MEKRDLVVREIFNFFQKGDRLSFDGLPRATFKHTALRKPFPVAVDPMKCRTLRRLVPLDESVEKRISKGSSKNESNLLVIEDPLLNI